MAGEGEASEIPQFVSGDELTRSPVPLPTPPPVPVTDYHTLALAIRESLEYSRPKNFDVINFVGTYTGILQTYQKVVEWIPNAKGGILKEISITNDPNAQIRLVVSANEKFKDVVLQSSLTIPYERMRVPGGSDKNITVYAKSTSGVSITVQAMIDGEDIG